MSQEIALPETWEAIAIKDLGAVVTGRTPRTKDQRNFGPGFPFVTPGDLDTGLRIRSASRSITDQGMAEARRLPVGSVLVTCIGVLGKVGIAEIELATNQQINAVVPDRTVVDPSYLAYGIASPQFRSQLVGVASSTTLSLVNKRNFSNLELPVAPLPEQHRIVEAIETHFSRIDAGVESLQRAKRNIERMSAAILKAAFGGRLVPQDPNDEPADDLLARITNLRAGNTKRAVPKPKHTSESIPNGWVIAALGHLCDLYQPKTIPRKAFDDDGEFLVFGANGPIGRYHDFNHEDAEVLIGCRGTCGTVNMSEPFSWVTGNAMVAKPWSPEVDRSFVYWLAKAIDYGPAITGTAQPQITRKSLAPLAIGLPPLAEQSRIVAALETQMSMLESVESGVDRQLARAGRLRSSVLLTAFSGHLVEGQLEAAST